MKDRIKRIIRNLPTAILMWFTVLVLVASALDLTGWADWGGLWPLLWLILIIGVPVAMPIVFLRKTFEKVPYIQKWWFWLIGALCSITMIAVTADPAPTEAPSATTPTGITIAETEEAVPTTEVIETTVATTAPTEPPSPEEVFVEAFSSYSGLKDETAKKIYSLLHNEMHFDNIQFSGKNEVGQINWDILADDYKIMLTADDDGIYRALCGGFVLYENSQVAMTREEMESRDISTNASLYYVVAKEIVSNSLTSPSSARFCSMQECAMQRNGDIAAVKGYVEAKNAFGVMLKNEFLVQFLVVDADTYTYEILYVAIGGQSVGEFVDMD